MTKAPLWTRRFFAIIIANGLLFASFHCLLPTLPLYVASLGASGAEIGLISGIFGVSAIFIRFFTDDFVKLLGKKKCLYLGLFFSLISTVAYAFFTSIHMLLIARVVQGLGFGLGTTFAAALAVDIIPSSRRGEGVGYFGLGNTISMGIAPALGVMLLTDFSSDFLFAFSTIAAALAVGCTVFCSESASATYYNMLDVGTSGGIIVLGGVAGVIGYVNMFYYVLVAMVLFLAAFLGQNFYKPSAARKLMVHQEDSAHG